MQPEIFRGTDLDRVMRWVRREMGEDALVLDTRVLDRNGERVYELSVLSGDAVGQPGAPSAPPPWKRRSAGRIGPCVLGIVGPPGAGKTTTAIKLAVGRPDLGSLSVGLVTLDTFRVGAVDELQTYAEIAGLPLEVVYEKRDVPGVMERLRDRDLILVDSPGRSPDAHGARVWPHLMNAFRPHEVHLVLPAGLRLAVAESLASQYTVCPPTHVLPSRMDELPEDQRTPRIAGALRLPMRWVAHGQDVPGDLTPADRYFADERGEGVAA